MAGKLSENPSWFWPLVATAILAPGFIAGLIGLVFLSSRPSPAPKPLAPVLEEKVSSPPSVPQPQSQHDLPPTSEESNTNYSSDSSDSSEPTIERKRCIVTLVKAFNYSFEQASSECER
jgi:hypothetical protein